MGGAGGTPAKDVVQEGGSPLGRPLSAAFSDDSRHVNVSTEKAAPLPAVWDRE